MKKIFLLAMAFIVALIYAQTPISSNRIQGSSIVLNNLSESSFQKIMKGTIFDVFDLDLGGSEYNTDLKKISFLETSKGQEYQERLESLRNRLNNQGIKIIPLSKSNNTTQYITTISNYDVEKRGFNITIGYNEWNRPGVPFQPGPYTNIINGFRIPNIVVPYFINVPINVAQKIEGNTKAIVQLQLAVDTFAIQKIFIINIDTLEVYTEAEYGH
jgi:hypothetical protein